MVRITESRGSGTHSVKGEGEEVEYYKGVKVMPTLYKVYVVV